MQSCCLSWYKTMEEKKELLDQAIATLDGNCIMAVLLFIKKTVDECKLAEFPSACLCVPLSCPYDVLVHGVAILLNILERYPVAAQHYAKFLKQLKDWKALKALYRYGHTHLLAHLINYPLFGRRLNDYDNLGVS